MFDTGQTGEPHESAGLEGGDGVVGCHLLGRQDPAVVVDELLRQRESVSFRVLCDLPAHLLVGVEDGCRVLHVD